MDPFICFQDIHKNYGSFSVLDNIDLLIQKGEIFGLLGINGAGKTTLIRSLMGLLKVDSGKILLEKKVLTSTDIRNRFGFLPENFFPPKNLTAFEFLKIMGQGVGADITRVSVLLKQTDLARQQDKPIRAFSKGMIQRLGLCCALLKDPEILVLDEPTQGLDPLGQTEVLELMRQANKRGRTIFFSSHSLNQIDRICTRIGVIHAGRIGFAGTPADLKCRYSADSLDEAFLKLIQNDPANTCHCAS